MMLNGVQTQQASVRTLAKCELERVVSSTRAVELRAVLQRAHIVHCTVYVTDQGMSWDADAGTCAMQLNMKLAR